MGKFKEGYVVVSVMSTQTVGATQYFCILFRRKQVVRFLYEAPSFSLKVLLRRIAPDLASLHKTMKACPPVDSIVQILCQAENADPEPCLKIGVLLAMVGQDDENEHYSNQGSPAFDAFLDLLGTRVRLKDYDGYAAQVCWCPVPLSPPLSPLRCRAGMQCSSPPPALPIILLVCHVPTLSHQHSIYSSSAHPPHAPPDNAA